jgi:TRAP-type mannitol/chloroaromatic compound transport system permease small subunit
MIRLQRVLDRSCEQLVVFGGWLLVASAVYVSMEVIARKVFLISLEGANEISSYVVAITSAWAFSYALIECGHIRIDAVYSHLSERNRALIDVLSAATLAAFAALLVWFSFRLLEFAWVNDTHANTPLRTPMWIPLLLWYLGLVLFLVMSVVSMVRAAAAWRAGDFATVRRIAGMTANEAEVELRTPPPVQPLATELEGR